MNSLDQKKIIIGVITCSKFDWRIKGARSTWLKGIPDNVKVLFVYGRPGQPSSINEDRLYLDCEEAYENLPQKIHLFFEYCNINFSFDYILKVDDDSYIDIQKFLSFDTRAGDYIGLFKGMCDEAATRTWHYGKCTDKSYEVPYEGKYVCEWARGGGYLLSKKAVEILVKKTTSSYTEHLFEDKMVGEALTVDENIRTVHAHYVEMGILNPMSLQSMQYIHQLAKECSRLRQEGIRKTIDDPCLEHPVNFGSLRRLSPISVKWGYDRGKPIDRYYIENFLKQNSKLIQGRVLEIKDRNYTSQFGDDRVNVSEILDIDENNKEATIVADITQTEKLTPNQFDCIIFTQTLQLIAKPEAALRNLHYILKPGGVLLLTCPGITKIQTTGPESEWYWSFTPLSLQMLATNVFEREKVNVKSFGNVFAATCFLWGIAMEEIDRKELDHTDGSYPLTITVRAVK